MNTQPQKSTLLCVTGLFAAMITLVTGFILHIPYGSNGGYIHFGDAFIFIAASMLPKSYAIAATVIGAGLADLLTAPVWMPATIVIKFLLVLPFNGKHTMFAPFFGIPITVIGYYIAEVFLFGSTVVPLASVPGNLIQAGGSIVIYYFIKKALSKISTPSFKLL